MKSVEKYVLEPSDIGDMAENSIENLGIEPSAHTDIGVNSIASHALEPSAMMEIGVNTIASHAREPSDIGDMVENSIEKHELESSEIRDKEVKSFANHALEPSAILEIGVNSKANHAHEPSAIMDKGVNTIDTNSMQILNGADCLKSIIAGDVSVEPVCEDGELCVCEVSTGVKPQKRKSGRQKVQERKTKRHCSGKSGCENEVEIENKRSRHTNRELKESCKNLRNRISKLTADVLMLEKLRNQVNDRRSHCRKQGEKLSQTFTQTKKTVGKGKSERLKFSLPDFDSFIDDSVSGGPSDENNVTNDLNYREPVFLTGSVSFDMNLDKDVCEDSDDDDLPVGLTPIKIEKFFQEKDIVWVKWKGWPYLPAMVKRVYKKKKRMTCLVFTPEDKPEKPWSVSTAGGKVWSYFDEGKKEEILKASETLEQSQREYFKDCMARLEMYLTRKALGQIKDDYAYLNQDDYSDRELMDDESEEREPEISTDAPDNKPPSTALPDDQEDEEEDGTDNGPKVDDKLSKKGEMRKEKLRQKTQKFTDFLLSTICKEYLQGIFSERTESERHKIFLTGTVKQKARLKHQGYGPIDDETQIMSLLTTFASWLKEINNNPCLNDNAYIMDVWAPEAIVFAYQNFFKYNKKRAWEMFYKGVRRTKEELKSEHDALMEHIRNMTPEEKRSMEERHEEMLRAAGIELM